MKIYLETVENDENSHLTADVWRIPCQSEANAGNGDVCRFDEFFRENTKLPFPVRKLGEKMFSWL